MLVALCDPKSESYEIYLLIQGVIDLTRAETDKPIHGLHHMDIVKVQGTHETWILPPPQLLGYLDESEESTSILFNITLSNSKFHSNTIFYL